MCLVHRTLHRNFTLTVGDNPPIGTDRLGLVRPSAPAGGDTYADQLIERARSTATRHMMALLKAEPATP